MGIKLFCFPYAAGIAGMYNNLFNNYPSYEIVKVEYSGHGRRFCEDLIRDFNYAMEDIYHVMCKQFDFDEPYALMGYSLGSLFAYEIYQKIAKDKKKIPSHVFLGAIDPPSMKSIFNNFDNGALIKLLKNMGGTDESVFENQELLDLFLPIFKADLQIINSYQYSLDQKIECPLTVMNGIYDNEIKGTSEDWKVFAKNIEYLDFDGGHFFINDFFEEVERVLYKRMQVF